MVRNEGNVDRIVRIVFGLALLSLVVVGPRTWFGLIGIVPLVTGLLGWCPLYDMFGVSSCRKRDERARLGRDPKSASPRHLRVVR